MRLILFLGSGIFLAAVAAAQTPALRKGVSVQMPVSTNAAVVRDADLPDSLVVAVTSRGTVFLEVTTVTLAQLSEKLKADLKGRPGKRVYVKVDTRTPYSSVAGVLGALQAAGVKAPVLLTSQSDPADNSPEYPYIPPKGLEVLLPSEADAAQSVAAKVGRGQPADATLKQQSQRGAPIMLQPDVDAPFGDVVHAVDVCRGAGAKVFFAAPGR